MLPALPLLIVSTLALGAGAMWPLLLAILVPLTPAEVVWADPLRAVAPGRVTI
jgi:hypothetical protein